LELLVHFLVIIFLFLVQKFLHNLGVVHCLAFNRILDNLIVDSFFLFLLFISLRGVQCLEHFFDVSIEFVVSNIIVAFVIDLLHSVLVSFELLVVAVLVTGSFDG